MSDIPILLDIPRALQALANGEVIEVRLNSLLTTDEIDQCFGMIEETVYLPVQRVKIVGLLSQSYLAWCDLPDEGIPDE